MADNVNVATEVSVKKRVVVDVKTKLGNTGTSSVDLSELQEQIDNKVDKVEGKELSSNDFTDDLKSKLESLENYDDTDVCEKINKLESDKANSSDIPTKVSQLENDRGYLTEHQDISGKADKTDVYTKEETDNKLEELKQNISKYSQSFTGTVEEYKAAEANGLIPEGMIVYILDDDDEIIDEPEVPEVDFTSSILGIGKLGYMILG